MRGVARLFYRGVTTCNNAFPFLPDAIFNVLNPQQDPKTGLTDLGVRVVNRLLDRGILVDITHSTELAQTRFSR